MYVVNTTTVASVAYNLVLKTLNLKDSFTFHRTKQELKVPIALDSIVRLQSCAPPLNKTVQTRRLSGWRRLVGYGSSTEHDEPVNTREETVGDCGANCC